MGNGNCVLVNSNFGGKFAFDKWMTTLFMFALAGPLVISGAALVSPDK